MQIGNRFRCYPTPSQSATLLRWIGCQRFIYNAKVGEDRYFRAFSRKCLALAGTHAPIDQQYSQFKTELTPWLKEVPSQILRNGATKWMQAYSRFFNKLGGRPTIQKKHGEQSVWLTSELFKFVPSYCDKESKALYYELRLGAKKHPLGVLNFKSHKPHKVPNSISISVHAGRWHVSFSYDNEIPEPDEKDTIAWLRQHSEQALLAMTVSGDRGVTIPFATSDNRAFRFSEVQQRRMARQEKHKKRWQRRMARRIKGSSNWHKARQRVANHQRYAADVRRDFAHQTSYRLVSDPRVKLIAVEALKLKNMTARAKGTLEEPGKNVAQKAGLNRAMLGSALGSLKTYMQYKARRSGKLLLEVPPHYSSQECAACGFTHPDNRKTQSGFVCQRCGNRDNADFNAAKVIAKRGVKLLLSEAFRIKEKKGVAIKRKQVGAGCSEPAPAMVPTLVETDVSRLASRGSTQWSLKQETLTTSQRL